LKATGWNIKQLAADLGIMPEPKATGADRREWQKRIEQEKKLRAFAQAIELDINHTYTRLAAILRRTYKVTVLESEEDMDRPEVAMAFDLQAIIPFLLDELESKEPGRRLWALDKSRELIR